MVMAVDQPRKRAVTATIDRSFTRPWGKPNFGINYPVKTDAKVSANCALWKITSQIFQE